MRARPAAGIFMALTRRCPLACEHCSTNSLVSSEEFPEELFYGFVKTFTPENKPDVILLTGGEPLLRPKLVIDITEWAHSIGTTVCLISGMFFANQKEIPPLITQALSGVDLFTASLDYYHEKQVPRKAVFRVLHQLLDQGKDVSLQIVGLNEHDSYLADVTKDVIENFGNRVPMFVSQVGDVGRAKNWLNKQHLNANIDINPEPCAMSSWPVISFDGTIVACCNQDVINGPVPSHLRLGHAAVDDWKTVRERLVNSEFLRAIRLFGPEYLAEQYGSERGKCDGYCSTCYKLSEDPVISNRIEPLMKRSTMDFVEEKVLLFQQQRHYGIPNYAHLVSVGYKSRREEIQ
ncbi:radical SAM protein [Bacillus songklensis]|uniref:Radical SAM protein n=1 Tax=Bacillus songklensis TaxID=1069116 RepID=A0ABV8B739_9BACI